MEMGSGQFPAQKCGGRWLTENLGAQWTQKAAMRGKTAKGGGLGTKRIVVPAAQETGKASQR